jgi:hypothetical protein
MRIIYMYVDVYMYIELFQLRLAKVVPEQSGKVEYERGRLAGNR